MVPTAPELSRTSSTSRVQFRRAIAASGRPHTAQRGSVTSPSIPPGGICSRWVPAVFSSLNRWLAPTDKASTTLLWVLAGIAIAVALWGSTAAKALVAGWMVLP